MKFLVTGSPGPTSIPREQGAELLQAGIAWVQSKTADGNIDVHYSLFGGGGFTIVNADTNEELLADLLTYPLYPFFTWEVAPLLDYETTYGEYGSYYQRLAG